MIGSGDTIAYVALLDEQENILQVLRMDAPVRVPEGQALKSVNVRVQVDLSLVQDASYRP